MKALIIGGTGVIGTAAVRSCLEEGWAVTAVSRRGTPLRDAGTAEYLALDCRNPEAFASFFRGRAYDVVIDLLSFDEADARRTVRTFAGRCGRFLFVSSVAVYRRPLRSLPCREEAEALWDDDRFPYGHRKAGMERYLLRAAEDGVPLTIVRPALTFGPGAGNFGVLRQNTNVADRVRRHRPLVLFGDGTVPWNFTFSADMAAAMTALLKEEDAVGAVCHVAGDAWTDWRGLYEEVGRLVGEEPVFAYLPSRALAKADTGRCGHLYHEKSHPGLFDTARLKSLAPGFRSTVGLREGLSEVLESWRSSRRPVDPGLDRLEDRLADAAARTEDEAAAAFAGVPD